MRRIRKQAEPASLTRFKASANEDWQPDWNNLGLVKRDIQAALITEQGDLCCYCEMRISAVSSHIEHIHPRSRDPVEMRLDYSNLLGSCGRDSTERKDRSQPAVPPHCGASKQDWYEQSKFVSPLDADCEDCFRYAADGQILPSTTRPTAARETIQRLALDIDKLQSMLSSNKCPIPQSSQRCSRGLLRETLTASSSHLCQRFFTHCGRCNPIELRHRLDGSRVASQ